MKKYVTETVKIKPVIEKRRNISLTLYNYGFHRHFCKMLSLNVGVYKVEEYREY